MEIEQNSGMWERIAATSLELLCVLDKGGNIITVNSACKTMLGYEWSEVIGTHYTAFLFTESKITAQNSIQDIRDGHGKASYESSFRHKNGMAVNLAWSALMSPDSGDFFCTARNVTNLEISKSLLEESEQRYRSLFDNSPDIIFIENAKGEVTEVNQRLIKTFGKSAGQLVNLPAASFLTPEMATLNERYLQYALLGSQMQFDLIMEVGGETKQYDAIKHPIVLNNEVVYVQTIAKDITSIVRSYEIIQQQSRKLHTIFESITDALLILDNDWCFTYINKEAERLVLLERQLHLGKNIWEVFPDEFTGEFHQQYVRAKETGNAVHFEAYYKGRAMWVEAKVFPSSEGLSIYFSDITERVKARQELEKLSLVASKTNNSVIIANNDYEIEWVNEGFTRLFGYSMAEAVGKKPSELLNNPKTDELAFQVLEEKLKKGESISFDILNSKKSGEEIWLSVEVTAILDSTGQVSRFIEVHTDITALKESELELSKLAKELYRQNSDLQQFTYIVSHNLRSPVANALGLTNLMTKIDKGSETYEKLLANLKHSVVELDLVLRDVNTILTIRDGKSNLEQEQVSISDVLQQALSSLQDTFDKSGGTLRSNINDNACVRANKAYLYSIFYNLLSNAIKYRSENRPLEISIKCFTNSSRGILISFSDNGSGFNMKLASNNVFRLYKRFHSDKKGRGIGLYLVKSHLEAMGGHIEVTSQVNVGTKFLIYLPR